MFLLWLIIPVLSWAQDLRTSVDRNTVYEGETIFLAIEAESDTGGETPDIGQLTYDFHILGSAVENTAKGKRWVFEIEPKRSGELRIPAMRVGAKMRTSAMTVTVLEKESVTDTGADVFLEILVEPKDPYVQSQVRYSERLFVAVPLSEGALSYAPMPQTIVSQPLGEEMQYVASRNGRNYRVAERLYALFPEKSGTIVLPPVLFRGRTSPENRTPGQRGRSVTLGRRIQIQSEAITLNVRARPQEDTADHWLPAANLTLQETWSLEPLELRAGEPVTRTLTIEAQGLMASQLPELAVADIAGANIYPDQIISDTWHDQGWHYSQRDQRIAIVARAEGVLSLPEVRLRWWDTGADRQRTAVLPARTINVLPGAKPPLIPPLPDAALQPDTAVNQSDSTQTAPEFSLTGFWPAASLTLFLLWLLTLFAWRREYRRNSAKKIRRRKQDPASARKRARRTLQQACRRNDAHAAARALLYWAKVHWPDNPPANLAALAMRAESIREPVLALDRVLYSPDAIKWRGKTLWRACKSGLPGPADKSSRPVFTLSPLYPQRDMAS